MFSRLIAIGLSICMATPFCFAETKLASPAKAQQTHIDGQLAVDLVRTTLMTIHDANVSGNYTVLRDLGTSAFQKKSANELANVFEPLRRKKLDLFAAASTIPSLTGMPELDSNNRLRVAGVFTTKPVAVSFAFTFELRDGHWHHADLLIGIDG